MNKVVNHYRYKISDPFLGDSEFFPLGESEFEIKWERRAEDRLEYEKKFDGTVILTGAVYQNLLTLENSTDRCQYRDITVERRCGNAWTGEFTGRIGMNDGEWDLDRCSVKTGVEAINPGQCLEDNKTKEQNFFELVPTRRKVKVYSAAVSIEFVSYSNTIEGGDATGCNNPIWGGAGTPEAGGWLNYRHQYTAFRSISIFSKCYYQSDWARLVQTVPCGDPSPGPEWVLLSHSCPGAGDKYAKPVALYACETIEDVGTFVTHSTHECKISGYGGTSLSEIDNGMELPVLLQAVITSICPGLTVKSNFFQINPDDVSDINYVTGVLSKVLKIAVFQKSDVKRAPASENATKAPWTFEKFISALCRMFNLKWRVEGSVFRLEHVSYYSRSAGFDLTAPGYAKYVKGKRKYKYSKEEIPAREEFKFMEASDGDFKGVPIFYSGACVGGKNQVKTYTAEDVTTDVELAFANPDPDSNVVDDRGFVFIACFENFGEWQILSEPGILSDLRLNNTLSWAHLHQDYHKYERPLQFGNMNGEDTEFLSILPTKAGEPITIPLCCGDDFNPDDTVTTPLGTGIVDKATYSLGQNTLTLDIVYQVGDLIPNAAPTAADDTFNVNRNVTTDLDVKANDSDPDSDPLLGVVIIAPPLHGVATVTVDNKIAYTPNTGYVGDDVMTYKVYDSRGAGSNTALVAINVQNPDSTLTALDDTYETEMNEVLNVSAGSGILVNDVTTAGAITATAETKATTHGNVQIFADGHFQYTPASGYTGPDSFTYTCSNGTNTDTGLVSITVKPSSVAIALELPGETLRGATFTASVALACSITILYSYVGEDISSHVLTPYTGLTKTIPAGSTSYNFVVSSPSETVHSIQIDGVPGSCGLQTFSF